jgi:uncharacterized membrane protein
MFAYLPFLEGIDLSDNQLEGVMPLDIINYTSLAYLDISNNLVRGTQTLQLYITLMKSPVRCSVGMA